MIDADALIDELRRDHPAAADLALRTCLPVRVTPAFVRMARLRLLPQAGTGDEADLWLSELVQSRSGSGFSLRPEVRQRLRSHLADDRALLDRVWSEVHAAHAAWLTPRARLEEELTWRLLRDPADAAIDTLWAGVVKELDDSPNAEGIARWVIRALPDLPEGSLAHAHGRLAFHGAHLLLGDASVFGDQPQSFVDSAAFAFATRRLPRQAVTVGAIGQRLLASATDFFANGHTVQLPATRPLWLQVEAAHAEPRVLLLDPAAPVAELALQALFEPGTPGLRLRALDGAAWDLQPGGQAAAPPAAPQRPRVDLSYPVEMYGARKRVQLPFVVGVIADLGVSAQGETPDLAQRQFWLVDEGIFDQRLAEVQPSLAMRVPDPFDLRRQLSVHLAFKRLSDWEPAAVAAQLGHYVEWQSVLKDLAEVGERLDAGTEESEELAHLLTNITELDRLRGGRPQGHAGLQALAKAAAHFGAAAFADPDPYQGIQHVCEQIRQRLNRLLNDVYRHADFRRLEATWRGLHHLVSRTPTDEMLKIRVLHATRKDLQRLTAENQGRTEDQHPLFKKIVEEEFGQFGGEPCGLLLVDHAFDQQPGDVAILRDLARIGARAHAPVLASASRTLFQLESWRELASMRDLSRLFVTPEYAAWRSLRESDDARYLCLTLPRVLAREPWTGETSGDVAFDEVTEGESDDRFTWMSSAWLMAANIAQAFDRDHWFAHITGNESGGLVTRLPTHAFHTDSALEVLSTGFAISDRMESALSQLGLTTLVPRRNSDSACFYSAPTLYQPPAFEDRDAMRMAQVSARLAHVLVCSRLMLHMACFVRDLFAAQSSGAIVRELQQWVSEFVSGDPPAADEGSSSKQPESDAQAVQRPFAAVHIEVIPADDGTDQPRVTALIVPRYQFQDQEAGLRLTHALPMTAPGSKASA